MQSLHHFTPGQLALMIAQVGAAGARTFVGIDGRWFVHDALVSARRLYAEAELELVASIAAPTARVSVGANGPFHSVLTVEYP